MKLLTVIGARPQFIKAATVSRVLEACADIEEIIVHTGQHYDKKMSDLFFEELNIPSPKYNLNVGSESHGAQTGRMLAELEKVMMLEKPDWVLVYGDTNSTLAGALAAKKLQIKVAHVEAGLRSKNRLMPEEINRVGTDAISDLLFAPTQAAVEQLISEGREDFEIIFSGDVMYDLMLSTIERLPKTSNTIKRLNLERTNYLLVTLHRAENTDEPDILASIIQGLVSVSKQWLVVFPLHPRTEAALKKFDLYPLAEKNFLLLPPLGYFDMVTLLKDCVAVATDSGGLQKEAFFLHKICFTLRHETEWGELIDAGWNRLVPPGLSSDIANAIQDFYSFPRENIMPYGEGNAAEKIVSALKNHGLSSGK